MESELKEVSRSLCERVAWERPELARVARSRRSGDSLQAALRLVRHLRARRRPVMLYSRRYVAALRACASPRQKAAARASIEAALKEELLQSHTNCVARLGANTIQLGATPELCGRIADGVLAARPTWSKGTWGTLCSSCMALQALWPLDEFEDAHVIPFLCWMTEQGEPEWNWARTWDEVLLGNAGHNWWLYTFLGFWMAGTFFPELDGFARFRHLSEDFLEREMQVLMQPDGFTKERAGYHWGTVDLFVTFTHLAELNGARLSPAFHERLREAAATAWKLVTPDGDLPQMGDAAARHRAGSLIGALRDSAARFGIREARFVAQALDPRWKPPCRKLMPSLGQNLLPAYRKLRPLRPPRDTCLPASGYYVMRSGWTPKSDWACIDAGARGSIVTSHDHTAVFTFELYSRGRPALIDNSSGPYGNTPPRTWREGSAAHNVATVDGQDHLPIRNEWRWNGLVQPIVDAWITAERFVYFSGAHEGYDRLPHRVPGCRRKVFYLRGQYWILIDRFTPEGDAKHQYQLHFHLAAPSRLERGGRARTCGKGGKLLIVPVPGADGKARLTPNPYPLDGYDNPDHLTYTRRAARGCVFVTLLVPFAGKAAPRVSAKLARVECDERVLSQWEATALRIRIGGREHFYFDQHIEWNLPWRSGGYSGTGRLFHSECR